MNRHKLLSVASLLLFGLLAVRGMQAAASGETNSPAWVETWATSPQPWSHAAAARFPVPEFTGNTLRQIVRISIGGTRLRLRLSNAFGATSLDIAEIHIAPSNGGGEILQAQDHQLTFGGKPSVSIPAGALMVSDPIGMQVAPLSNLAITMVITGAPDTITTHPGSRTTSYLQPGNEASAAKLPSATKMDHWYYIDGIDVANAGSDAAVVVLGDSITDGHGATTNGNDRWTDRLAERLQQNKSTRNIGVLNEGIGGNRLLRDGSGPNALARLDRDVLAQPGARWLIVLEGINDLGTRLQARKENQSWATAEDMIAAYQQIILRAHARNMRVYGCTILPFVGSFYSAPDEERDREAVNQWIRTSGAFDGVIDFDAVMRDPKNPTHMLPLADSGDHLHPNPQGYKIMGDAVDLKLFVK